VIKFQNDVKETVFEYRSGFVEMLVVGSLVLSFGLLIHQALLDSEAYKGLAATSLFLVISLCVIQKAQFRFNKLTRECVYQKRFGLRVKRGIIAFALIDSFRVEHDSESSSHRLILCTTDDTSIAMMDTFIPDKEQLSKISKQLNEIAGTAIIPEGTVIPSLSTVDVRQSALALLKQGRKIDAMKLVRTELSLPLKEAKEYCDALSDDTQG